ncbi:hypothetical protein EHM92_00510 [bacterium]|nr:MAG: hypothetical protein EHM92_00510 [bacterium]
MVPDRFLLLELLVVSISVPVLLCFFVFRLWVVVVVLVSVVEELDPDSHPDSLPPCVPVPSVELPPVPDLFDLLFDDFLELFDFFVE